MRQIFKQPTRNGTPPKRICINMCLLWPTFSYDICLRYVAVCEPWPYDISEYCLCWQELKELSQSQSPIIKCGRIKKEQKKTKGKRAH